MFAGKYWFDLTDGENIPFGYKLFKTIPYNNQMVDVYQNSNPVPIMYTLNDTLNYDSWKSLNSLDKMRSLMTQVITYDSDNKIPDYYNDLIDLGKFETQLVKTFDTPQSKVISYAVFPRSEEVRMKFYLDGELVREFYSYEPNYSSVYVEESFDEIHFEVTNLYGVPSEEFINQAFIEYPEVSFDSWYNTLSEGFISKIEIDTNQFSGYINSTDDQWVVTSIAYDKNWKVKVNNEYVNIEKINGGFIGFRIPSGEVEINGVYFPNELLIGAGISFVSIIVLILMKTKHWI